MIEDNKEFIILVDESDKVIGAEEKIAVHQKGKLHRAFSIFVFNSEGRLLIQRRNENKYHSGGLWTNTVCSHPRFGESLVGAVHRRLEEEMGFDCPLREIRKFHYRFEFENGLVENEIDYVFVGSFDGEPVLNFDEVIDCKWVSMNELREEIRKDPEKYSYWIKVILEKFGNELFNYYKRDLE